MTKAWQAIQIKRLAVPVAGSRCPTKGTVARVSACALMAFGSGCAMLPNPESEPREATPVESTRTPPDTAARVPVPAAPAGGNVYALNSANCMRDWARPECQYGAAAPESNDPQQAPGPSPEGPPPSARNVAAGFAAVVLIITLAVAIGIIAGNAIVSGAF